MTVHIPMWLIIVASHLAFLVAGVVIGGGLVINEWSKETESIAGMADEELEEFVKDARKVYGVFPYTESVKK